jgi:DNA-binding PadR family transcriptional regulator
LTDRDISLYYRDMHKRDRFIYFNTGIGHPPGPPWMMPFQGPGAGPGWGRGRRMRRGNVRAAILLLLEEGPRNGSQLMQELEQRSGGAWRPSPGSVYPALQLLADEGLVRSESRDGGNVFELTDAGRQYLEENRERLGTPWEQAGEPVSDGVQQLVQVLSELAAAARQVIQAGSDAQAKEAAEILAEARRSLYRLLAEK